MTVSLKSRKNNDEPLFHLVDHTWDKNGYIFQYFPVYEEEAQVTIPGLIPLLPHKFADNIMKSFTLDAVECMQIAEYDVDREVLSPMDACMSTEEVGDAEFDLESEEEKDEKIKERKNVGDRPNHNSCRNNYRFTMTIQCLPSTKHRKMKAR